MPSHSSPPAAVELGPEELARLSGGSASHPGIPRPIICYWPTPERPLIAPGPSPVSARRPRGGR